MTGAFHSTKTFENFETAANGTEMSRKSFQKFSKIWVYLARLSSFSEILENTVPFATGSCRKLKADVLVEWKAPDVSEMSAVIAVHSDDVSLSRSG